jgi:hypothetical protein
MIGAHLNWPDLSGPASFDERHHELTEIASMVVGRASLGRSVIRA